MAHLLPILLQAAAATVAVVGLWRATTLHRLLPDPRLRRLQWFFGLLAGALAVHALGGLRLLRRFEETRAPTRGGRRPPPGFEGPDFAVFDGWAWAILLHHLLLLAAFAVAIRAFGTPRRDAPEGQAAPAGPLALALPLLALPLLAVPLRSTVAILGLAEAVLALYLALRSLLNHAERRTRGALQAAVGFLLFFVSHTLFWLLHVPRGPRPLWGELLELVGVLLLVGVLPAPRGR